MRNQKAAISPRHDLQNVDYTSILAKHCHICQGCPCTFRYEDFPATVARGNFDENLEILSFYGFHGDLGIWAIRAMQDQMRRVER